MFIPLNVRNGKIINDILQRRLVILNVRLMRKRLGLPSQEAHLPLSYLLDEKPKNQRDKIEKPPDWFFSLDLENLFGYNVFREPSERIKELDRKITEALDALSTYEE